MAPDLAKCMYEAAVSGSIGSINYRTLQESLKQAAGQDTWLHVAARFSHLDRVPRPLLTMENCLIRGTEGQTVFHAAAACHGQLQHVRHLLNQENIILKDDGGQTVLLLTCISRDNFQQIPEHLITPANLLIPDDMGMTPLHVLCCTRNVDLIPAEACTLENLTIQGKQPSPAETLIKNHQLHRLPPGIREALGYKGPPSPFQAAIEGWLYHIPEFLNQESLGVKMNGRTWMHYAAATGMLYHVPKELLTKENLACRTDTGDTVYHLACRGECFDAIPQDALDQETINLTDAHGNTVLLLACQSRDSLENVPRKLLTTDNLSRKNSSNIAPYQTAYHYKTLDLLPSISADLRMG